ncbi:MAG TPA: 23S rRNA (adenine(2503)-C(2))-methyltransferase RlmN, partial [Phycisphaerales bacterium]|nr:23S rRNA (adenine(2503)-C(2))-methyltransferase RlmN [Phycisphaerales bacterium]
MNHPSNHIFEQTPQTLEEWCSAKGWPKFRAGQILEWVYQKGVADPGQMSNLSKLDRQTLAESFTFLSGHIIRHQMATDQTQKLLVQWTQGAPNPPITDPLAGTLARVEADPASTTSSADAGFTKKRSIPNEDAFIDPAPMSGVPLTVLNNALVPEVAPGDPFDSKRQTECVMIPADDRRTACISSQVGCPVGCKFCASGLGGLDASLSTGRIIEQIWRLGRLPGVGRISNVVFMGMGEPLANLTNVVAAVRTMSSLWALGISARKITISTVGLPQAIRKLSEQLDLPVTLALSLHAPNDTIRRQLIPWASYTTIQDLLAACREWFEKTGREITLEYTLLRGINDRPEHAAELAQIARTLRANINLIRYNEVTGVPFQRPRTEDVLEFQRMLKARQINTHIRASRGRDIAAACGQLR